MPTLNYTPQQAAVIEDAHAWFRNPSGIYRIDGKAGTGKTSCANAIASIARNPSFLSFSVTPEFDTLLPSLTVTAHASYFTHPGSEPEFAIANTASHFDFAYAITVHKAQGSEWPSVAIVDESSVFRAHSRNWLYTAITRAEDSVLVAR